MHKRTISQLGRTMLEMIAVVCLMALISIGVFQVYAIVADKAELHTLNQEINTRLIQLRHLALTSKGIKEESEELALSRSQSDQSASALPIRVTQSDENKFILVVGSNAYPLEEPLCQKIIKSHQENNQQCFRSGKCNGSTGEFEFSKQCNPQNSPENSDFNCGQNAHRTAFSCDCDKGYTNWKEGEGCILAQLNCGANAYQNGPKCVCEEGYENWEKDAGCSLIELDCGANAYQDGPECVCDEGYENWEKDAGCSLIELYCGTHAYQDGPECVCDEGYENWTENSGCSLIQLDCDPNAYQDETLCKCNAGYYGNGITCSLCEDRRYSSENSSSCSICPAGKTHNSSHTGCQNCTASMTLGGCGCASTEVPNGSGGCQLPCTSYANTSTTVREGYQITGTPCYCVSGYTLNTTKTACEAENTCAPGICMTCTNGTAIFKSSGTSCVQAGISGTCTQYGQCIPSGTSCSSSTSCPSGYFCNYGGTYGNYGQGKTPNICEKITTQTKTINGVTYYYNTLTDLKSWCRPADGGKNCIWGYLAWYGADSWCKSQGKRLLTMSELQSVRSTLKDVLPTATTTYWCSDGTVNILTGSTGSLGRKDGYANAGAVVCR